MEDGNHCHSGGIYWHTIISTLNIHTSTNWNHAIWKWNGNAKLGLCKSEQRFNRSGRVQSCIELQEYLITRRYQNEGSMDLSYLELDPLKNNARTCGAHAIRETHANGRLTEQAVWQWTGKQNARTKMQPGVMLGIQAMIPLVRYNSRFCIIPLLMHSLIHYMWWLCFTFRPAFSAS